VVRKVDLAMEEVRGVGEGLGDVGKHVYHGFVDPGAIGGAGTRLRGPSLSWPASHRCGASR
jgi:hypothetical protein